MCEDAFEIESGSATRGLVLLCDHASNALPNAYGTLGLPPAEFERHIAYDIGAAAVTRRLAGILGVPAVLTRYSRLLIDCNRGRDDPTLIMRISDGAVVPGNRHLDAAERERRLRLYYEPYHRAVDGLIDDCIRSGPPPMLISLHSFTGLWKGQPRPWHAGILWDRDDRAAAPLIAELSAERHLVIGDNEPYTGRLKGDTMWQHGTERGLAHAIVEIRQDLIATEAGVTEWSDRLARIVGKMLACPELRPRLSRVAHHGSYAE
ncbi:MAG: N-formylglutamate amidohydrolase [Hyphomicrobium sp.]